MTDSDFYDRLSSMENQITFDDHCFCCGSRNERGLKLKFRYPEEGRAETECRIPEYFTGWQRITHGGFLSMMLDEAMAHACVSAGRLMVTVELSIRYLKPVEVGETIRVQAEIRESKARLAVTEGWIENAEGQTVARGTARFLEGQKKGSEPKRSS